MNPFTPRPSDGYDIEGLPGWAMLILLIRCGYEYY